MNKKKNATFKLSDEVIEILRKLSFVSRKNKSLLVEEAIRLLAKTPGGEKN